jgi:hypothetical protein
MFDFQKDVPPKKRTLLQRINPMEFTKAWRDARKGDGSLRPMPFPLETYIAQAGSIAKTPVTEFSWKFMRDMVYTSDLLSLIVRTKTNETFRNGITIAEKFKSKCTTCGREFEEERLLCPYDNGQMVQPDYEQWKVLNEFLSVMNRFDESILTTMREVDTDIHIGDNGWVFLMRDYDFDEEGNLTLDTVTETVRFDPNMIRLIMSRYGMGTSEMGTYTYFCVEHRMNVDEFAVKGDYKCKTCGKHMLPAWYMALTRTETLYYGPRELYHMKLYSNAQGYGVSPLIAVYMKVNALLRMDKFILDAYSLQRAPQELLILRGKLESIHRAWEWLMQKARENPNMVYPLVLEGDDGSKTRVVEHETFSLKPIEYSWTEMRQEFRTVVGLVYGVQPLFGTGQQTGGGLANEGLQIAVTSLAIKQAQQTWNSFLQFLSRQLGATDYQFKLNPNEQEDELQDLTVEEKRVGIAQTMKTFGYDIEVHKDAKGRLEFSYKQKPPSIEGSAEEEDEGDEEEDEEASAEKSYPSDGPSDEGMTSAEHRDEQAAEARRKNEAPPPKQAYSDVSASLDKQNIMSGPAKKLKGKKPPRGDEDADTTSVTAPPYEGAHVGGLG